MVLEAGQVHGVQPRDDSKNQHDIEDQHPAP